MELFQIFLLYHSFAQAVVGKLLSCLAAAVGSMMGRMRGNALGFIVIFLYIWRLLAVDLGERRCGRLADNLPLCLGRPWKIQSIRGTMAL